LNPKAKRWERYWLGALTVALFLFLWEIAMPLGLVKIANVSRPTLVIKALVELFSSGGVFQPLAISLKEFVLGLILAIAVGIPFGIILGRWRVLNLLFDPMLMALYTMPRLAMMPLLVVWFGIGLGANTAVVFLGAVFSILVNTCVGTRMVDRNLVRAVRSFGGSEWDIFMKVLLPGSVPPIMTGIRLGVGRGLLGVVVSEMYAGTEGIGYQIDLYASSFRVSELIALIALFSFLGFVFVNLVRLVEEKVQYWGMGLEI